MNNDQIQAELMQRGFNYLTEWKIRGDKIKPGSLDWKEASGWIYAFTAEGRVRYVGIATTVLRSRLDGYSYQTNDRVGAVIRSFLDTDRPVSIYGLMQPDHTKEELEAKESKLIEELGTDWNVRR